MMIEYYKDKEGNVWRALKDNYPKNYLLPERRFNLIDY